jgi:hypothetical protein
VKNIGRRIAMEKENFENEFKNARIFLDDKGFVVSDRNLKAIISCKRNNYPLFINGEMRARIVIKLYINL